MQKDKRGLRSCIRTARSRRGRWILCVLASLLVLYGGTCGMLCLLYPQASFPEGGAHSNLPAVFPAGFLCGTATAAHQIEGGNTNNDWWRFEPVPNGDRSGAAVDSWNRVADDIALMKSVGANAYRFSVEWSRLEPNEGVYDAKAFEHYRDQLRQLRADGITPMVTLLHFTLPQWLADKGGLLHPNFPERFAAFVQQVATQLGDQVSLWCTINEPNVQMYNGYIMGIWPPGRKSNEDAARAFVAMLKAHAKAAAVLHRDCPGSSVGVAMHLVDLQPRSRLNLIDWYAAGVAAQAFNWAFYDCIAAHRIHFHAPGFPAYDEDLPELAGSADYFGVNYYRRELVGFDPRTPGYIRNCPGPGPRNDLRWEIHPEGLLQLLRASCRRYHLPIYITENGIADRQGQTRVTFLDDHLYAVALALQEGIPVRGYFHWSLMDNFEWAEGFAARFGLFSVDHEDPNLTRRAGPGAAEFRRLSAQIIHP